VVYPKFAPANDPSISETTGMTSNPWPSSDWIAAISERGLAGFIALALFVAMLLGRALKQRYDSSSSPEQRLAALAGGGVLFIAVVEGLFDAVLLLPTPAIIVWAAAGALIAPGPERDAAVPTPGRRILLAASFAALTICAGLMSERRIEAMRLYEVGSSAAIESALLKDPGSYRIQMRGAEHFVSRGQCAKARAHAVSARELFPSSPGPRKILAECR
jgi:hypothetical protein